MFKRASKILGVALLAALALAAGEADAADACVPPGVSQALADCSASPSSPTMSVADLQAAVKNLQSRASRGNLPDAKSKSRSKGTSAFAPRELDDAGKKLEGELHRFLCNDKPAPGDAKAMVQHVEIAYALARLYFEANHFAEASVTFRDIALHHADTPSGIYASQLYLESINVLGSEGATSCYDDMSRDVPAFLGLYCKDGKEKVNAEQCGTLTMIQRDILRLQAEQKVKEGERGGADGRDGSSAYEAAGAMFLQIWEQYGRAACEAKSSSCARSEEVLYNAARAYQAAHNIDKSIAVRKVLIDPKYNLDTTELGRKALYEIGTMYQSTAYYEEAATWYERFARTSPKMDKAPEALMDATVLRLGLDQVAQAEADAGTFTKNYGSMKPGDTARIAFAIAMHLLDRGDDEGARRKLESAMPMIDKSDSIDLQIVAHAALGKALSALHKDPQAAEEYGKVRAIWRDPVSVVKRIMKLYGDNSDRPLARALTAQGEALFFFAEEKRRAADAIKLPIYAGTGKREDVMAYINGPLAAWLQERRTAIGEAEKAYVAVLEIQPMPPPKWVVPSAQRVARMHGRLAAQILSIPLPKGWKTQGPSPWGSTWEEVRAAFRGSLEQASDPFQARARKAYLACADMSVKYQYFDSSARSCSAWLSSHYPAEFPRVDEILDKPSHRYYAIERGSPLGGIKPDP